MTAPKHTPGPWAIEFIPGLLERSIVNRDHSGDDWDIATVHSGPVNAHLIAAAPELYEACQRAFEQTDRNARPNDWDLLRAALAKARGEG